MAYALLTLSGNRSCFYGNSSCLLTFLLLFVLASSAFCRFMSLSLPACSCLFMISFMFHRLMFLAPLPLASIYSCHSSQVLVSLFFAYLGSWPLYASSCSCFFMFRECSQGPPFRLYVVLWEECWKECFSNCWTPDYPSYFFSYFHLHSSESLILQI